MANRMGSETYGTSGSGGAGASSIKGQIGEAAEAAKDKLDSVREPIADKLRGAAETLREKGDSLPGGAGVASAAQGAAAKLESSASYIESHNARQMIDDVLKIVKNNPAQSLLIAGALGFLLARAFRRD